MTAAASAGLWAASAAVCLVSALLALGAGRLSRAAIGPALCCLAAAIWATAVAAAPQAPLHGAAGTLEVLRLLAWGGFLLLLCRRATAGDGARGLVRGFGAAGAALGLFALLAPFGQYEPLAQLLDGSELLARVALALLLVALAENVLRNADERALWHVNLPCIALGGLAAFDVALYAQAALAGPEEAPALLDARAAVTALAMPLLALGAARDRRLQGRERTAGGAAHPRGRRLGASRQAVFHGATFVVAGGFLVAVGALGEGLRRFAGEDWGATAQAALLAAAGLGLAVALASRSARSRLRRALVDPFFAERFDYRAEWQRCVATLAAAEEGAGADGHPPAARAVRALADAVDSPAGLLLLREPEEGAPFGFVWAGSWNLRREPVALPASHPLAARLAALAAPAKLAAAPADGGEAASLEAVFGPLWLAVPLARPQGPDGAAGGPLGAVLLAPPRAPFPLDDEVRGLLATVGREVAMFLAERRAAERLADARGLADYAQRFAFVAHDVKTVASQLRLMLANAEDNLQDPEFQRDLVLTMQAAAERIDTLIARLRRDGAAAEPGHGAAAATPLANAMADPLAIAHRLAAQRVGHHPVCVEAEAGDPGPAGLPAEALEAALGHLLDNAVEASPPGVPVTLRVARTARGGVEVAVADRGPGMSPEFVRDGLFRPLTTTKPGGNGIGAWQARELLRQAGGDLAVDSRPGQGTVMRLLLPPPAPPGRGAGA